MSISFVRIDDRVIHGQLVTRWAKELPCDGIVAIDDAVCARTCAAVCRSEITAKPRYASLCVQTYRLSMRKIAIHHFSAFQQGSGQRAVCRHNNVNHG